MKTTNTIASSEFRSYQYLLQIQSLIKHLTFALFSMFFLLPNRTTNVRDLKLNTAVDQTNQIPPEVRRKKINASTEPAVSYVKNQYCSQGIIRIP